MNSGLSEEVLQIKTIDAEIIKDGTSYLVSDNDITGASLEVLSFVVSGIKKKPQFDRADGRPGRINYGAEDEYRTVNLTVRAYAEDEHDITHLRTPVEALFDGVFHIRELRSLVTSVPFELPGQNTGKMATDEPTYTSGQQLLVTSVSTITIPDGSQMEEFNVELETVELPYWETVYTTRELNDTGYDATVEKYGLVDGIDDTMTQYVFTDPETEIHSDNISHWTYDDGSIWSVGGANNDSDFDDIRTRNSYEIIPDREYTFTDEGDHPNVSYWWIHEYDENGNHIQSTSTPVGGPHERSFAAQGSLFRLSVKSKDGFSVSPDRVGDDILPRLAYETFTKRFEVYNAGNVAVRPESMFIEITLRGATSVDGVHVKNLTTGDTFAFHKEVIDRNLYIRGMNFYEGTYNALRDTNRQFISIAPGVNEFEIAGADFSEVVVDFKYYYK